MKVEAIALAEKLLKIGETIVPDRACTISDAALRELRVEVQVARGTIAEGFELIGYEAAFLLDAIAEIDDARRHRDAQRESRAAMYINTVRSFLSADVLRARRETLR